MADGDFIGIDVQGIEETRAMLRKLPPEVQSAVVADVTKFLLNVFKSYPPQKYVSRAEAYPDAFTETGVGPGWFSDKQRRWFFANLGDMNLP